LAVSNHYLNQTLHHLSQVVPVSYRRIFAGVGIYHQAALFALVVDNSLYFRVDEHSVLPYLERRMPPLRPASARSMSSHFYQLPEDVLHNAPELLFWMRAAVEASLSETALAADGGKTGSPQHSSPYRRTLAG